MADTFTPTVPPQENPNGSFRFNIRKAQFGNGYTQRAAKGINNRVQSWPFTFVGTDAEIAPIKTFLETHAGQASFYYTPPFSAVPILFVCETFTLVPAAAGNASLSANFEESNAP